MTPPATPAWRLRSGGQTGVDRAALDAAIELGLSSGGFVPAGGWAEDAPEPPGVCLAYPWLRALASGDPSERTRRNVEAAGAVLVLRRRGIRSPGTDLTVAHARANGRPLLEVDPSGARAAAGVEAFLAARTATELLVAGPRASEDPQAYEDARALLRRCAPALRGTGRAGPEGVTARS